MKPSIVQGATHMRGVSVKPSSWFRPRRNGEGGQALVIALLVFTALLGFTGVVIDGGNLYVQQRGAQNSADSGALAGATVLVERLSGSPKTDGDVMAAINQAMADNHTTLDTAWYVDPTYANLGNVGGGAIPNTAWGVHVVAKRTFNTYVAGIMGFNNMTATAEAVAVAGVRNTGGALPLTFSVNMSDCAGNGNIILGSDPWPIVSLNVAEADKGTGHYESIVPLCKNGPGNVGWIDLGDLGCPGSNVQGWIDHPCDVTINIPAWLPAKTGNMNSVDLSTWRGRIVMIPLFDGSCRDVPSSGNLGDCTNPGNGSNFYYHIPKFAEFLVDEVYIQGNNNPACNTPPGGPPANGNGGTGCLKGWFVSYVTSGPVRPFNPSTDYGAVPGVNLVQ